MHRVGQRRLGHRVARGHDVVEGPAGRHLPPHGQRLVGQPAAVGERVVDQAGPQDRPRRAAGRPRPRPVRTARPAGWTARRQVDRDLGRTSSPHDPVGASPSPPSPLHPRPAPWPPPRPGTCGARSPAPPAVGRSCGNLGLPRLVRARRGDPTAPAARPPAAPPHRRGEGLRLGVAPVSSGDGPSDRSRHQPAAAIIAALSVHIARPGTNGPDAVLVARPRQPHRGASCWRPPRRRGTGPWPRPPRAPGGPWSPARRRPPPGSWRPRPGGRDVGVAATWLTTAVFSPLKLKS